MQRPCTLTHVERRRVLAGLAAPLHRRAVPAQPGRLRCDHIPVAVRAPRNSKVRSRQLIQSTQAGVLIWGSGGGGEEAHPWWAELLPYFGSGMFTVRFPPQSPQIWLPP